MSPSGADAKIKLFLVLNYYQNLYLDQDGEMAEENY